MPATQLRRPPSPPRKGFNHGLLGKLCRKVDFAVARSGPESRAFSGCGLSHVRTVKGRSNGRVHAELARLYGPYSFWERLDR